MKEIKESRYLGVLGSVGECLYQDVGDERPGGVYEACDVVPGL